MQADPHASEAALGFRLAAWVDQYLAQLAEPQLDDLDHAPGRLMAMTATVRGVRTRSAG